MSGSLPSNPNSSPNTSTNLNPNDGSVESLYSTRLSGGKHWSMRLRRGLLMQLRDIKGGANVGMVFYNTADLRERYNAPDTLKCQHTFYLTQGHCLYSDMGRIFASVIDDTLGAHETMCGNSNREQISRQYGARSYQQDRNTWHQNGHDAFMVELSKYELGRRDLPANVNWFSKCAVRQDGAIDFVDGYAMAGSEVSLRIEMDCLVVLHTCPHPMASAEHYPHTDVGITLRHAPPMTTDDICLNHCDENRRGFENNRLYHLGSSL